MVPADLLLDALADIGLLVLDGEGQIISWNLGAEHITGWCRNEILGRHFPMLYPAEDVASGGPERQLARAVDAGRYEEQGYPRKNGSHYRANVVVTPLRDEGGNLQGFAKVVRDVTERLAAEEALWASEAATCFLAAIRSAMPKRAQSAKQNAQTSEIKADRSALGAGGAGKANKVIAHDLKISPRTVEIYRAKVMTKMQARRLSALVRMALLAAAPNG